MSAIIMGAVTPTISTFNADTFVNNAGIASYRNFLETKTLFNQGMQTGYVADTTTPTSFFQTYAHWDNDDPDQTRFATSVDGTVTWSDVYAKAPKWAGAKGSTLIFVNNSVANAAQSTVTGATFNSNSITLTDRGHYYIGGDQNHHYYTFSSSDLAHNLSGSTIGATFNKVSDNGMNMQLIIGLPGNWDFVKASGLSGRNEVDSFDITGLQKNDVIFLGLTGFYDNIYTFIDADFTNATQKGSAMRSRWKDNQTLRMLTVDADGDVTVDVPAPYTTSPYVDPDYDGAGYIVMRYAG